MSVSQQPFATSEKLRPELRRLGPLVILLAVALAGCAPTAAGFTAEDEGQVLALEEAYRVGWLAGDSDAVMATLDPEAVLMPAGVEPLVGGSAIREFWWPDDGSVTTIHSYEITIDEVQGSDDLAYVRGRGFLEFTYRDPEGTETRLSSEAVHLSVARRGPDGGWRIVRRAWGALRSP